MYRFPLESTAIMCSALNPPPLRPGEANAGGHLVSAAIYQPHYVVHVIGNEQAPAVFREREAHGRPVTARFGRHLELAHELALLGKHLDAIGCPIGDIDVVSGERSR